MPTLREIIFSRCTTHAGTAALIGTRCYPDRLPEDVTLPAIRYILVSATNQQYRDQDGATQREASRVQFDCYATIDLPDGAAALADQIRDAWDGYSDSCTVGYAFQANRLSSRADALNAWREIVDVIIEHGLP